MDDTALTRILQSRHSQCLRISKIPKPIDTVGLVQPGTCGHGGRRTIRASTRYFRFLRLTLERIMGRIFR